ncbi:hypothetical protein NE237_005184 [Protea cynaroides]|uniref:Uncharacterized protein n=1 Tax=Protea cynaroides TaxID=273540 RepID=A0A9Q0QU15_9MAGN|nr:hypothetical protein NE237_005184 [Protea cynaroides]
MGLNLFKGSGSDDDDNNSKIEINKEFARHFEHNKKREDLQRLEDLKKKGLTGDIDDNSPESSSDEDEDDLVVSGKKDLEFLNALIKVKNRDPILKQKDAKLFDYDDDEEEEEEAKKPKLTKDKPMYLKDVVAKQLIEEGPEFEESNTTSGVKSY